MTILYLILGLICLVVGAEALVRGASRLAISFGVSPLVVGLTIVAFGTSAPEAAVSVGAVASGTTDLAIGNVVGSNIFNILVILGLAALIKPIVVHAQIVRQEVPIMLGASVLLLLFVLDGRLQFVESLVLLVGIMVYAVFLVRQSRAETKAIAAEYSEGVDPATKPAAGWDRHWAVQSALVVVGLGLLVLGSELLVDGATTIAKSLGVSDLVIGLTIVAAGTSLPEVATSVLAAFRGQSDIAVGNVIGSNIFNIFLCLGAAGSVAPEGLGIAPSVLDFDIWVMLGVAIVTVPLFLDGYRVTRANGLLLVAAYGAYTVYLVMQAQGGDTKAFGEVMMRYAVPSLVVVLMVLMVRGAGAKRTS